MEVIIKWREILGVLYDKKVPLKVKGKFCKTVVRLAMMYESEFWAINKKIELKIKFAEIQMLIRM